MNIQKRPNGKWRARYRDETGREHSRHFERKLDAQKWLADISASMVTGSYIDPRAGKITLQSFYDDWARRQVWAPTTVQAMDVAIRSTPFASIELGKLRRSHVEAWVKACVDRSLAPSTIRTRVHNVSSVLRAAQRDRLIASDTSEGVVLPRQRKAEHAMVIPTPEQVGAVISSAEEWFRPLVSSAAFSGLRLGEAAALQLNDVQFLKRKLEVRRQVQRGGAGRVVISPPKYGSERVLGLPRQLSDIFAQHIENVGVVGAESWLFVGKEGQPPHQNTVAYWWRKTLKAAGVEPFKFHHLRHFFASGLIAAGCDVVTVQHAMGHAKASTTLEIYSHLWPTAEDQTRTAAEGMMQLALDHRADSLRTESA